MRVGNEAQPHPLLGLWRDHRADLGGELAGIALEQPKPVGLDPLRFALDLHVALEHHAAQLVVLDAVLDADGRARIALEVLRLLRLRVGPADQLRAVRHVPERHQVRAAVRAHCGALHDHLLGQEGAQLGVAHRDLVASAGHGRQRTRVVPEPVSFVLQRREVDEEALSLALAMRIGGNACSRSPSAAPAANQATVTASKSLAKGCHTKYFGRPQQHRAWCARARPRTGLVRARLSSRGDWDVGGLRRQDQARAWPRSSAFRGNEVAEGFVTQGPAPAGAGLPLRRQRLERAGGRVVPRRAGAHQVAARRRSSTCPRPTRADKRRLQTLGLDLTESGDAELDRGRARTASRTLDKLRAAKFHYTRADRRPRQARSQAQPTGRPPLRGRRRRAAARCRAVAPPTGTLPTTSSS